MQDGTPIIIKKKKSHGHAHHGGAWKVAYADFVTAMMAFFMVMWIMTLSDTDRQLVQAYFEDPTGFSKEVARSNNHIVPFEKGTRNVKQTNAGNHQLLEEIEARGEMSKVRKQVEEAIESDPELSELMRQKSIETLITQEGLQIELIESDLNGEVFFKVGSDVVQPRAIEVLARIAPILAATGSPIVVEGHTDSRPFNRNGYDNYDLSGDRAHAVRRLLMANGIPTSSIEGIRGYADQKPRVASDTAHFSNRRVTILLPFKFEEPRRITELPSDELNESIQGVFRNPFRD